MTDAQTRIQIALAWCIAWGNTKDTPNRPALEEMRTIMLSQEQDIPPDHPTYKIVRQVRELEKLEFPETEKELKELPEKHPLLWNSKIGLVYGGATKIKQYVFEAAKLPDIRGASAILDRINLIDLPAFFGEYRIIAIDNWLNRHFPELQQALIPESIVYSTGGNILAFCPAAFVDDLANAIERRYTEETLTANSCAVGAVFRPLQTRFGLLRDPIEQTLWLEWYREHHDDPLVEAYFGREANLEQAFRNRKSFNELAGKLASQFNRRRNGNSDGNRPSRCHPPMFETHPCLMRDESDRRCAILQAKTDPNDPAEGLPGDPWFSEALARKRLVGQIAKREYRQDELPRWYERSGLEWRPGAVESWVSKFERFLVDRKLVRQYDPDRRIFKQDNQTPDGQRDREARSIREIADNSSLSGFVTYIYADGNNMGGYIQTEIDTPQKYQQFSQDVFKATEYSVYQALADHLHPHCYEPDTQSSRTQPAWIHPFEILTIGGDDVMLIVPADKALAVAKTIGETFEKYLLEVDEKRDRCDYTLKNITYKAEEVHRYRSQSRLNESRQCKLSMSSGVLITAENTPIYYAHDLVEQLQKSAKKRAKQLKTKNYHGGTVDFFVMKAVTMISSTIEKFREEGLIKSVSSTLKLYAAPYTLHELGGLIEAIGALKQADFSKSQLYQIRSLLEQGRHIAILNYRYLRVRLKKGKAELQSQFEEAWCLPKDPNNKGNLAPWMYDDGKLENPKSPKPFYETIWRELVDLYDFIETSDAGDTSKQPARQEVER